MSNSKQIFNQSNVPTSFYGMLALHLHRWNQAIGITRITPQVSLLLYHYNRLKQQEYLAELEAMTPLDRMRLEFDQAVQQRRALAEQVGLENEPQQQRARLADLLDLDGRIAEFVAGLEKMADG